ncbi:MAG: PSD1 and planctomycete cytochrome C domain-containing protein [Bryobacter sp.]|nr:PSD1 and planctomycete cytochrome C domain-containing protein [Bryobacter sp.]
MKFAPIILACFTSLLGAQEPDFARDVFPILRKNCYACHGPGMQQSGFRLDDAAAALEGGNSGAAILPGKSAESPLLRRVHGNKGLPAMPPGPKRLAEADARTLAAWIDAGAKFPATHVARVKNPRPTSQHWAFQTLRRPELPASTTNLVAHNEIDHFVLARLAKEGIAPAPPADKRVLLRRLSLDLTGLPPTVEEMATFLGDTQAGAYERQVDRLLASPHYGERWARPWLDQARYADSDGYEKDWTRPWAWRWRRWVIDSLNRDQPFDEFTRDQLAGDLVPNATTEQRVATGFHRNTLTNREGGIDDNQFRFEAVMDRSNTVANVWLGLTTACAQCHDHKYDPITQKDHYALYAFFDNAEEVDIDAPLPGEIGPWLRTRAEYQAKREKLLAEYNVAPLQAAWEKEILYTIQHPGERTDWDLAWDCVKKLTEGGDGGKIVQIPPAQRTAREQDILTDHFIGNYHFAVGQKKYKELKLDELKKKIAALKTSYPQLTQAMTLVERPVPQPSHVRVRGDYKSLGVAVEPNTPAVLPPLNAEGRPTRLDLARWLTSPENPLTARVFVNRVWQELFGAGLVRTPEDFGVRSEKPIYPELLDWLAAEFQENRWSRKNILRKIVLSSTYRQSADARPELNERDPNNTLLARQNRLRLPAEVIRDSALAAGNLLTHAVGGPSVQPPIPPGVMEMSYASRGWGVSWNEATGPERYRRGLYIQFLRTSPYPLLANFDAPKSTVTACKRDRSNTPLQALNLLNDPVFLEAAQALAVRTLTEAPANYRSRLDAAFAFALGRPATDAEALRLSDYLEKQETLLDGDEKALAALAPVSLPGVSRTHQAAWTGLASIVLNLDEFITRE